MHDLIPVLVTAIIFGFVYSTIQLFVRKKERLALLDKGADASFFISPQKRQSFIALKVGLLCIGVAVGVILGSILFNTGVMEEEAAYFSMIFLFGGIGLVVDHFMEKAERKEMKD